MALKDPALEVDVLRRMVALAVLFGAALFVLPTPAASAAPACTSPPQPGEEKDTEIVPWQQNWLGPQRVWPLATGAGQTVAVVDSGVDGTIPQLRGTVRAGYDVLRETADDNADCGSYGTSAAALIAARSAAHIGFLGLAPGATILPIRVTDADPAGRPDNRSARPDDVATGIRWATTHGATVVTVSEAVPYASRALRSAVAAALRANVVVVAAVGDQHDDGLVSDPPNYPAALPGVVGVGSIDSHGGRGDGSQVGDYVDLVAPGDGMLAPTAVAGYTRQSGTSYAAALVAATAALVRQSSPGLSAAQVAQRLVATADPAPGGQHGPSYGHGVVDPYRAVAEGASGQSAAPIPGVAAPSTDPAAVARAAWWGWTGGLARIAGGAIALAVLTALVLVAALRRGRGRRWRPARTEPAPPPREDDGELDSVLFAVPGRPDR